MKSSSELTKLLWMVSVFTALFFMPIDNASFQSAVQATLDITKWYAREHTVLCLLPAFFIAGVIAVFFSKGAIMRYLGAGAPKWLSYSVAAVSGAILSVCSCTVLPLFTSIRNRGAGLGPAIAFLYSGPAISMIAIILTTRILGFEMGIARTACAIIFSIIVGGVMARIYHKEEQQQQDSLILSRQTENDSLSVPRTALLFFSLVAVMLFANWAPPQAESSVFSVLIFDNRWYLVAVAAFVICWSMIESLHISIGKVLIGAGATLVATALSMIFVKNFFYIPFIPMLVAIASISIILLNDKRAINRQWALSSWEFTKKTVPLMALGIVVTGFLLGSTHESTSIPGIIPAEWVQQSVGGNSLLSTFVASFAGAFMYFSSLTEVPIVQGLMGSGMGKGPALALLLAGPSLSLPNMLVVSGVMGWRKTAVYASLVIVLSTLCGYAYGNFI
ncbi:MAG: permease [Akkermansia sp.]|nr:permease [Bacteroidaceae bacterium]MBR5895258.1 permease [Akkermansia sp.]